MYSSKYRKYSRKYYSRSYSKLYITVQMYAYSLHTSLAYGRFACEMAETVEAFLAAHELSSYADAFDNHGWDSLNALRDISDADLRQLEEDVSMKSGHSSRLRRALGKVAAPAGPPAPAVPAGPPPEPEVAADPPAAAEQPPAQAAAAGGGADAGGTAAATAAVWQKKLSDKLMKAGMLGSLLHGNIIEVYRAPSNGVQLWPVAIKVVNAKHFYCLCCGIPCAEDVPPCCAMIVQHSSQMLRHCRWAARSRDV